MPVGHSSILDDLCPTMAAVPMLSKDAFQNEKSRKLFEAIDELRGSGIASDIDLPEVGYHHHYLSQSLCLNTCSLLLWAISRLGSQVFCKA